ncbi:MAG: CvpA family protein [Clostridiales bacterium]|nr:MAG: CvpA family protein [Clostridiales bacterium]RGB66542.1 CvpA family protein [Harryflintia acetispora]
MRNCAGLKSADPFYAACRACRPAKKEIIMQPFIPLIYDIATVIVFVYMIAACARGGFLRTIVSFIGYAAALVGAAVLSRPLAAGVYGSLIRPGVIQRIAEKLAQYRNDALPAGLLGLFEGLPEEVLGALGMDKEGIVDALGDLIQNGGQGAAGEIADAIVAPLAVMLLKIIFFFLIFGLLMIIVRRVAWVFGSVNHLPLLGPANRILGGAVGALQAALTMYVVAVLLVLLVSLTKEGIVIRLSGEDITLASYALYQRTVLFRVFVNTNPLDLLLLTQNALSYAGIKDVLAQLRIN